MLLNSQLSLAAKPALQEVFLIYSSCFPSLKADNSSFSKLQWNNMLSNHEVFQLKFFRKFVSFSKTVSGKRGCGEGERSLVLTLLLWNFQKASIITLSEKWGCGLCLIWSCKNPFWINVKQKIVNTVSPLPHNNFLSLFPSWAQQNCIRFEHN